MTDIAHVDPYATHQPYLMLAAAKTDGQILELGAGWYSTPLLHAIAEGRRGIITLESDSDWMAQFKYLDRAWHGFKHVPLDEWDTALTYTTHYYQTDYSTLCFVDQSPGPARGMALRILKPYIDVFVCHDTQIEAFDPNDYLPILDQFKYRRDDNRLPRTTIVSDTINITQWPEV